MKKPRADTLSNIAIKKKAKPRAVLATLAAKKKSAKTAPSASG